MFQTLQQSSAEVSKEKIAQGMKETDSGVFASVLTESVQKSIDKNSYGAPVTVTVKVEKNHSGTYELSETEVKMLRKQERNIIHLSNLMCQIEQRRFERMLNVNYARLQIEYLHL